MSRCMCEGKKQIWKQFSQVQDLKEKQEFLSA